MRIGIVVCTVQMGGVETVLKRLYRFLEDAGHQVAFVETNSRGRWADEFETAGLRVVDVLPRATRSRVHHARRIAEALKQYDTLLLNDTPYAQSVLGLLPKRTVAISILHMLLPGMVRNATGNHQECDAVVVVNPAFKDALVRRVETAQNRTAAIANGVEVPQRWPKVDQSFCAYSPLKVLYAGRIDDRQKGVCLLPKIVGKARESCGDIRLDIVGDGPDLRRLKGQLETASGDSAVTLHGMLSHEAATKRLLQSDVLLMPSRFEGMPIVLLEAMASGVVPVVTPLDGIAGQVVRDGANGFLVAFDDVEGFARALVEAARNREHLKAMSELAWQTVRDKFDSRSMGESYLDLIENLHQERAAGEGKPRSGSIDRSLLGDLPDLPLCLVRPARKLLRIAGLWPSVART